MEAHEEDQHPYQNQQAPSEEEIKTEIKGVLSKIRHFITDMLNIRQNTDLESTKAAIIDDISFRGHTIWILVCSIFIASVGLNANSTAVIIGAMLISPLMGPILGLGLSLATNDLKTMRRSFKNTLIMVSYSVFTAYLFFEFFPIQNETSELLARTSPDFRDVLIAFFGGLALAIARAKKGTIASVIFGVAIATALMPPLCTVGYGLAIRNWEYAGGAMYLFSINAIFIALATFIVLKYLRMPMVKYISTKKRQMIHRLTTVLIILVIIPATVTFYNVFQETRFKAQAQSFVNNTIGEYEFKKNGVYLADLTHINYEKNGTSSIEVVCVGDEVIPRDVILIWEDKKNDYSRLTDTEFKVLQGGQSSSQDNYKYVTELYEAKKAEIVNKDKRIQVLEEEVSNLSKNKRFAIPFEEISAEAKVNYEELEEMGFSYVIKTDFEKLDTIPIFELRWQQGISQKNRTDNTDKMQNWLRLRLNDSTVQVKTFNY